MPTRDDLRALVARMRPDERRPARVWLRRHWPGVAALAVAIAGLFYTDAWVATCGWEGCPSAAEIRAFRPAEGGRILDRNDRFLGHLTQVRRVNVPLSDIPSYVRQAFVATEDRRFYSHDGFDWRALGRAVVRNVAAGGVREGFSTITMQVVRNTFAQRFFSERTIRRKLIELRVSRLLEQHLTKDQILELYLNVIYLGNGVYGVEAASRDLFGKSARSLTVAEGAMLAALPKGPSAYTPRRSPRRALARRNLVLTLMVREGYLPLGNAQAAVKQPVRVARDEWRPVDPHDSYALDAVRSLVDSVLTAKGIDRDERTEMTVYTTLDGTAQQAADRAVARRAAAIDVEARSYSGRRGEAVEGAMIGLDPRTGDLRVITGGRKYVRGSFDRALAARRQPGSAFKPFVYAAALATGLTPATQVEDEPVEVDDGAGHVWSPQNYGGDYGGMLTLRRALARSANAATVRVSRLVGEGRVIQVARRAGITSPLQPVPAIALGALEVTPLELVTAYAPFANGGFRVHTRLVRRIDQAADGAVLWQQDPASLEPVMDARDAYQLTSMLRTVVDKGTGRPVRDYGVTGAVAGKTGTTNNGTDVWFVGYTPALVAAVWFGFDTPRAISGDASGGRLAAPAWAEFYQTGWRERADERAWNPPAGMVSRVIDPATGFLAGEWCPTTSREFFKPGTEPTEPCPDHLTPPEPVDDSTFFPLPGSAEGVPQAVGDLGKKIGKSIGKIFKF